MGIVEKTGIYQHIVITPPGAQGSNPHGDKDFSDSLTLRGRGSGRRRRFAAWRTDWVGASLACGLRTRELPGKTERLKFRT
jgi:hypothetical protein